MFIRQLHLTNYKNHEKKVFSFEEEMLAFVGFNGVGKTNILDALYTLCIGKSYFSSNDKYCIRQGEDFFRLEMGLKDTDAQKVVVSFEKGKRKKIIVDDVQLTRNAEHVGRFPAVVVSPNDNSLILGSSEERRRFMDQTLAQISQEYLRTLINYNKVLKQRNALLKAAEDRGLDKSLLAIYDEDLIRFGTFIYEKRVALFEQIQSYFNKSFSYLSAKNESFEVVYKSHLLADDFKDLLLASSRKDVLLRRTTKGLHRDDIVFKMEGELLKDFGSQGQQKTFLLALKLTQFNFLKAQLNKVPLFIIDDIFDKLDSKRSQNLVQFLAEQKGQVFISNTDSHIFQNLIDVPIQIIEVE